ncbi:probable C-mannosyltransferase DPY19L1 [Trematomus bernacchii]|uniref:probable C-mannosyltransferase DPY19L1 n=1 Tax=Trematomus bernacchii TaxID=40690 RepID=UPI00146B173E|nr:probable C-mannosyltransferase DPY19L1 [Trematomus bernacchii]
MYTCAAEFDFMELETPLKYLKTLLLPIDMLVVAVIAWSGENQAGVLHVQPHVCRHSEGEPDDAGGGLLRPGGFLVHPENRPGCSMPEIWDIEDSQNIGKVPLCTHMSRSSRPHFTTVFSNDIYKVLKVSKDLR